MPHENIQFVYVVGILHENSIPIHRRIYQSEHSAIQSLQKGEYLLGKIPIISGKPMFRIGIPNQLDKHHLYNHSM
jgi:hypothetical protein